ncbi:hypothetical protein [Lacrimispora sp.]
MVKKIDEHGRVVAMANRQEIPIDDIIGAVGQIFEHYEKKKLVII